MPSQIFQILQITTENWVSMEGVARFMLTGYTFTSFVKKSRQWSWNVAMDARHSGSIKELRKKKKKTVVKQCSFFFWPGFLLFWYSGYQYEGKKRVVFMGLGFLCKLARKATGNCVFWGRVSSHLCLLAAVLRVTSNNGVNLWKSVWSCLGCSPPWLDQHIKKQKHWWTYIARTTQTSF
jgi:hypothetical protein